jgi:hypothetical protein
MNTAAAVGKPGNRIAELNPFEPGQERKGILHPPVPEPAYGCVEWFHYLDYPSAPRVSHRVPRTPDRGQ